MMLGGAGAPARAHTSRMRARTASEVSRSPPCHSSPPRISATRSIGLASLYGLHGGVRRPADPRHLGIGLLAPALGEQILIGREREPRRPQPVAQREGEVERNGGVAYPECTRCAQAHFLLDLKP